MIDRYEGGFSFVVTGPLALGGLVDLPDRRRRSSAPTLDVSPPR